MVTRLPLTATAWVQLLSPGHMWDVFHPSQSMPSGFPLGVFFHPQKGSKLFHLIRPIISPELVLGDVNQWPYFY